MATGCDSAVVARDGGASGGGDSGSDAPAAAAAAVAGQQECPVCMDDFENGQEVRVLPCSHRFHPECIDPWLLNISGSCPLW